MLDSTINTFAIINYIFCIAFDTQVKAHVYFKSILNFYYTVLSHVFFIKNY